MTVPVVDWMGWRKCPVCYAVCGDPCATRSGRIVDGRPDGARRELPQPHTARRMRVRR